MDRSLIVSGASLLFITVFVSMLPVLRQRVWGRQIRIVHRYTHIRLSRRAERLLRKTGKHVHQEPYATLLQKYAPPLITSLKQLRTRIHHLPSLPTDTSGRPRILSVAAEAASSATLNTDDLVDTLTACQASPAEIAAFPACLALLQARRLAATLTAILQHPNSALLPTDNPPGQSFGLVLRRTADRLQSLLLMDWETALENADALHPILLQDPSGTYPDMDATSRYKLRMQVESFSRSIRVPAEQVLYQALALSRHALNNTLEAYMGYWLQDAQGLRRLHQALGAKRGWIYVCFANRSVLRRYILLLLLGITGGFAFLQAGYPVYMLPVFALLWGEMLRRFLSEQAQAMLPALEPDCLDGIRTLIVLSAELRDEHQAVHAVRTLHRLRQSMSSANTDFLLLGDFMPHRTAVSQSDAAIMQAAYDTISNPHDQEHFMYYQRQRVWNPQAHMYTARGGRLGALQEICRMISLGTSLDGAAFSSTDPERFERGYDYIFLLPEDASYTPGILEQLLGVMGHPLNTRVPSADGWRGYGVLSSGDTGCFESCMLIKPDVCLEATDGLLPHGKHAETLYGQLAGHARIGVTHAHRTLARLDWHERFCRAVNAQQLLPWQLPWVQTPNGLIRNPLRFMSRFRLREMLRSTLVTTAQFICILWGTGTASLWLMILALLPSFLRLQLHKGGLLHCLQEVILLPTASAVNVIAACHHFHANKKELNWAHAELWTQMISATITAAVGVALGELGIPLLVLGAIFAAFPLVHRV